MKQQDGQESQKLVYGYINGQKTSCMTEHQLRVKYSQEEYKYSKQSVEQRQKTTLLQNSIYRGNKNLSNANLKGQDLQGVDLTGADLRNSLLESCDLRNANLKNANLSGANLENAYCKNTNLNGANLSNTNLTGAFFHGTNLLNTEGLKTENLSTVATLYKCKIDSTLYETIKEKMSSKLRLPKGTWTPKTFIDTLEIKNKENLNP